MERENVSQTQEKILVMWKDKKVHFPAYKVWKSPWNITTSLNILKVKGTYFFYNMHNTLKKCEPETNCSFEILATLNKLLFTVKIEYTKKKGLLYIQSQFAYWDQSS